MKTYLAKYNRQKNKGVFGISLVENPAMEGLFVALSEDEKKIQFATVNEEKRILAGLVLEPNKPIYRNQNGEEFNIVFDEQTVEDLCYGFSQNKNNSNSTIEHDTNQIIDGVTFTENWLVRDEKIDTSVALGLKCKKGSWVAVMKVDSDEIWNDYVKTGKVQGFSIDAMLSLEEVNLKTNITMSKEQEKSFMELLKDLPNAIKLALNPKEVELKLGSVKLADGSLTLEFDGEMIMVDQSVWITAEDGTRVPVPVGEHLLEDGTTLIVEVEGIAKEVKMVEEEEVVDENAPMDMTDGKVSNDAKIASEIESAIKSILIKYSEQQATIFELKSQVEELGKAPASNGIKQPLNNTTVDLSKMTKGERILYNIKNN
jgi:hypothetical protein